MFNPRIRLISLMLTGGAMVLISSCFKTQPALEQEPSFDLGEVKAIEVSSSPFVSMVEKALSENDPCLLVSGGSYRARISAIEPGELMTPFLKQLMDARSDARGATPAKSPSFEVILNTLVTGDVRTLEADPRKTVQFYGALMLGHLFDAVPGSAVDSVPVDGGRAEKILLELENFHGQNGVYPLFRAVLAWRRQAPVDEIDEAVALALNAPNFKANDSKIARALVRAGLRDATSYLLADTLADYLPSPDFQSAASVVIGTLERKPALIAPALAFARRVLADNTKSVKGFPIVVSSFRRERQMAEWIGRSAWVLNGEGRMPEAVPEEFKPGSFLGSSIESDLNAAVIGLEGASCMPEKLEQLLVIKRAEFIAKFGKKGDWR